MAAETKALNELHVRVANHMMRALEQNELAAELLIEFPDLPEPVCRFLDNAAQDNPALLTVVTKFLKDNSITAAPEESKDLSEVQKLLNQKRARLITVPTQAIE